MRVIHVEVGLREDLSRDLPPFVHPADPYRASGYVEFTRAGRTESDQIYASCVAGSEAEAVMLLTTRLIEAGTDAACDAVEMELKEKEDAIRR